MLDFVVTSLMHLGIAYALFQDDTLYMPNDLDTPLCFVQFVLENVIF